MAKRIAYQGVAGSFSSVAARTLFGIDTTPLETSRFREIFEHIARNTADFGVVPIENALAGSVHEIYDLLAAYDCFVVAEVYCPVQLHLMGTPQSTFSDLKKVLSHPKALEQCSLFLEDHNEQLQQVIFSDTAGAALRVKELNDPTIAAIASEEAAGHYGLSILARSIQNHPLNATRFVAVAATEQHPQTPTKSSLIVSLSHEPGSLYRLLGVIADHGINLTKIESRPIPGKPFEYAFHLDLECQEDKHQALTTCIERVRALAISCRLLGLYRAAP
jgi:prephenate dehydratase